MTSNKAKPAGEGAYLTKVFVTGDSQAVRIPREIQFDRLDIDYEIERVGDEIRVRPARRRLTGIAKMFASFTDDFMSSGRGELEDPNR